jgi:hypothetical protein
LQWHPKSEEILWKPEIQQTKENKPDTICYKYGFKGSVVKYFIQLLNSAIPYCKVRYAF